MENPVWQAPEILLGLEYDHKVDIYGLGAMYWFILTREAFLGEFQFISDLIASVTSGERPPIPDYCPMIYKEIITHCWVCFCLHNSKFP